ncbi:hypothetical protein POX_h09385 [Penicillium oxalicum]|uniref:hypothetical protein n=1 Tax=Penicillium oxalicum TaxID=69781 RepID=UPI0020B8366D|nr:hypothetical protein POX_h09385 [Penicillium oxalicum]KAI2785628.1 hypothetical protein POX_h09385 [Penicillium oxalicum]
MFLSELLDLQKNCGVKLFATARPIPEITDRFISYQLEIRAHECDTYKEEIKNKITEIADGMFLLAQLHFDSIKTQITLKLIEETLRNLSGGPEVYTRAYEDSKRRIEEQDSDASKLSMNILMWITCAKRQLTIPELQEALAVEEDQSCLDEENIIGEAFMVSDMGKLNLAFLKDDAKVTASIQAPEKWPSWHFENSKKRPRRAPGLHLKAYFGLYEAVSNFFEHNHGVLSRDTFGCTPLFWAAENRQEVVIELLLERGADIDPRDKYGQTPLLLAASNGHESIVELLLGEGGDFYLRDEDGSVRGSNRT